MDIENELKTKQNIQISSKIGRIVVQPDTEALLRRSCSQESNAESIAVINETDYEPKLTVIESSEPNSNLCVNIDKNSTLKVDAFQHEFSLQLYQKRLLQVTKFYSKSQKKFSKVDLKLSDDKLSVKSECQEEFQAVINGFKAFFDSNKTKKYSYGKKKAEHLKAKENELVDALIKAKAYCVFEFDLESKENITIYTIDEKNFDTAIKIIDKMTESIVEDIVVDNADEEITITHPLTLYQKRNFLMHKFDHKIEKIFKNARLQFFDDKCVITGKKDEVEQVLEGIKQFLSTITIEEVKYSPCVLNVIQNSETSLMKSLTDNKKFCVFEFDLGSDSKLVIHSTNVNFIKSAKLLIEQIIKNTAIFTDSIPINIYVKRLLMLNKFDHKVAKNFPYVKFQLNDDQILISGSRDDIENVSIGTKTFLKSIVKESKSYNQDLFQTIKGKERDLVAELKNTKKFCVFEFNENASENVVVYSTDKQIIASAFELIDKLVIAQNNPVAEAIVQTVVPPIKDDTITKEIQLKLSEKNLLNVNKFFDKIKQAFPQVECSLDYEKCVLKGNNESVQQVYDGFENFLKSIITKRFKFDQRLVTELEKNEEKFTQDLESKKLKCVVEFDLQSSDDNVIIYAVKEDQINKCHKFLSEQKIPEKVECDDNDYVVLSNDSIISITTGNHGQSSTSSFVNVVSDASSPGANSDIDVVKNKDIKENLENMQVDDNKDHDVQMEVIDNSGTNIDVQMDYQTSEENKNENTKQNTPEDDLNSKNNLEIQDQSMEDQRKNLLFY